MASTTRFSGPGTCGSSRSSVALTSVAEAASAALKARSSSASMESCAGILFTLDWFQADRLAGASDLLDLGARLLELGLAVSLQRRAALIGAHGFIKLDLAALEPPDDVLELLHR